MARESGGGGALAWTLLGFLAGVAATLGLQLLLNGPAHAPRGGEVAAPSAAPPAVAASSAVPEKKKAVASAAPSATPAAARAQPAAEMADDAAAAGMTSRRAPDADPDVPQDRSSTGQ